MLITVLLSCNSQVACRILQVHTLLSGCRKQRDEHYTLAVKILEKMPEVLSAAAPEDQTPGPAENLG